MSEMLQDGKEPTRKKERTDDGFMVMSDVTGEPAQSGVVNKKTKFFRGKWAEKANPLEPNSVIMSVNGEPLTWQRGVTTIVPEPYMVVAGNAVYQKFSQEPNKGRKVISTISRFTWHPDPDRPTATFEEFRDMFSAGTKKTKDMVAQHGLKVPVEQSVPQL